jgi:hypothetical protein
VPTYISSEEDKTLLILLGSDDDIFKYMLVFKKPRKFRSEVRAKCGSRSGSTF